MQGAADILGLGPYLDRFPRQLSGGQRQRVAMGRAIVRDPQVFLFDEPLSNLDAKLRVAMRTEIKELHQRLTTTTVYVTHDQVEAMTMADRIVVMHDGLVEQIGAPLELYDLPDNLFVAGFIGSPAMNFLRGTIRANGAPQFEGRGGIRFCRSTAAPAGSDGRPAVYGIRPEHFTIADDGAEAEVQVVEPTGSELQVVAKLGGEDIIAVFRERHRLQAGRQDPAQARSAARASVRRAERTTTQRMTTEETTMTMFTRRTLVQGGTALAATGALAGSGLAEWAKAWAQAAPWKPEKGAQLSMLRWKYFVQSEDDAFVALLDAFTKATGVKVNVTRESYEDIPPKASVAANTNAGPDLFWGLFSLPHLFPQKCVDVTDVADYLGKKYGGWVPTAVTYGKSGNKWIAIPICFGGNMLNYRISALKKAGFSKFPATTDEFLEYAKATKRNNTPGGMALGHATGDGNCWVHWCLWAHGGNVVDDKDKVILNSPETVKALEYAKQLYENMIPGVASWNDAFNNKAFLAGEISLDQQRHLDLRRRQARPHQEGHRRGHGPRAVAGRADRQADRVPRLLPDPGDDLHANIRRPVRR